MDISSLKSNLLKEIRAIEFSEIAKDNVSETDVISDLDLWDGRNTCIGYADVEWRSSAAHVISPSGFVERQSVDTRVEITARFTFQDWDISAEKSFSLIVRKGDNASGERIIPKDKPRIFLAGDSTCSDYPHKGDNNRYPQTGWGQVFGRFFDDVYVINCARSGRSSKSFLAEDNFKLIKDNIQKGDYLVIQFAHNDSKIQDPARYTSPQDGTYQKTLGIYIDLAREAGANPVLCTPISRCIAGDTSLEPYVKAVKKLGADEGIPVLDLYARTREYIMREGEERARRLYKHIAVHDKRFTDNPEFAKSQYYDVKTEDNTHLNIHGALLIALWAAAEMIKVGLPIAEHINSYEVLKAPDIIHDAESASE